MGVGMLVFFTKVLPWPSNLVWPLNLGSIIIAAFSLASGDNLTANVGGTQALYGNIPPDQIEFLSTGDRIKSVAASGSMMAIWETLEHGEKVECLDCIPSVEPLLYDANPRTREIAAWWLRRLAPELLFSLQDPDDGGRLGGRISDRPAEHRGLGEGRLFGKAHTLPVAGPGTGRNSTAGGRRKGPSASRVKHALRRSCGSSSSIWRHPRSGAAECDRHISA